MFWCSYDAEGVGSEFGQTLAWIGRDVHGSSQLGRFESGGWSLRVLALARVKDLVDLLVCNVCIMRQTALFCLAIPRPFKCQFVQCDRMCGHVSLSSLRDRVQLEFGCVSGQSTVLRLLLMYCAQGNYSVWGIWSLVLLGICQKAL